MAKLRKNILRLNRRIHRTKDGEHKMQKCSCAMWERPENTRPGSMKK